METNTPFRMNGNVARTGLITNLPDACCVEVPCLVDNTGIQPCFVGDLPPQLAAINRINVGVQELAVEACLTGDHRYVYQAVQLDPLTGGLLTLGQTREMVDELFAAEEDWLPQFR
jgi:alpha-galactosidase